MEEKEEEEEEDEEVEEEEEGGGGGAEEEEEDGKFKSIECLLAMTLLPCAAAAASRRALKRFPSVYSSAQLSAARPV